jgi:hypothetical protein
MDRIDRMVGVKSSVLACRVQFILLFLSRYLLSTAEGNKSFERMNRIDRMLRAKKSVSILDPVRLVKSCLLS